MRLYLILILSITFFSLSLKSRIAGLYTYWWFAIFRPHDWVWSPLIGSLRLPFVAALVLVVPALLQKKFPKINNPIAFLMFLWIAILFIADTLNGCSAMPGVRTNTVFGLFVLVYICLLACQIINNSKYLFWLIFVLASSIAVHSGKSGIYSLVTGADNYGISNLSGLFSGSNLYALGSGMLMFFMIFSYQHIGSSLIYKQKNKWYNNPFIIKATKFLMLLLIFGTFYNIIAFQSRGAFLATVIGLCLWTAFQRKGPIILLISFVLLLSFGAVLNQFLPEGYIERIESAFVNKTVLDNSAASRPHFWDTAINIARVYPMGVGPGCYPKYYNLFDKSDGAYGTYRSVHSSHFQMLADSGYLGITIWVLLFLISFTKLWKIKRVVQSSITDETKRKFYTDLANMLICSQVVFLLGGGFYEYAYNDITWLTFALVIILDNLTKDELEKTKPSKAIKTIHNNA